MGRCNAQGSIRMRISVASGKGGTGKTTLATNLAYVAARNGRSVAYVDCDVEEPNGHIFLKPDISLRKPVGNRVPEVDADKCTLCGLCGDICQYSAIVKVGESVLVYHELCHGCGGCSLVCPSDAIGEQIRELGVLETGTAGDVQFVHGLLHVGEAMSPPLIREVRSAVPEVDLVIFDAPPGTSCPVIEAVRDSDFVILITEPTPFGLNDLKLAVEMIRALGLPFGVVVNRAGIGDGETELYCQAEDIEIVAEIPDDRRIAEAYSRGEMVCEAIGEYESSFTGILEVIMKNVAVKKDCVL